MTTLSFVEDGIQPFYLSQTYTFAPNESVNLGSVTLYSKDSPLFGTTWPGIPFGLNVIYGPLPTLAHLEYDITSGGALCSFSCTPPSSAFMTSIAFTMPFDQTTATVLVYSWQPPTVTEVPLPDGFSLMLSALLALGALLAKGKTPQLLSIQNTSLPSALSRRGVRHTTQT